MKRLTCASTEQPIHLTHQIASSGEGQIWATQNPAQLAKLYETPDQERIRKLETMIAFPPAEFNPGSGHVSYAWPMSLLKDESGVIVGFLMPHVTQSLEIINVYNPRQRGKLLPGFNWMYLHTTALNIASLIWRLHDTGYVLGDIKPQNILVNAEALPSIIDTDSFQVRHPETGEVFPCRVGSEGFTPRELLGKDLALVQQSEVHDRFRLGVVIYLLLFGEHPFKGTWLGAGDAPEPNELIRMGAWAFAQNGFLRPGPLTIPLSVVHPDIKDSFLRCFNQGHSQPYDRPSAQEWVDVLKLAIADLKTCRTVQQHYYSASYGKCYWCDRKRTLNVDVFNVKPPAPLKLPPIPGIPWAKLPQRYPALKPLWSPELGRWVTQRQNPTGQNLPTWTSAMPQPSYPTEILNTVKTRLQSMRLDVRSSGFRIFSGALLLLVLFVVLIQASAFEMTPDEIAMTLTGAVACLVLVLIGFFWMKVLGRLK